MAVRVVAGVPGSGKTFYAVWHLARNYFRKVFTDEEPVYGFFLNLLYAILPFIKPPREYVYELDKDCLIITNIDDFKPDHVDLRKEIRKAGIIARQSVESDLSLSDRERSRRLDVLDPVAEFFSFDYQERYKEGKPSIVYVIDEAQVFFRKGVEKQLKERDVFRYFEYHRHWGQDIYLVTQNEKKLPPDIVQLSEYIIQALPRVRSLGNSLKYKWIASGEVIKKETRFRDQGVFALYKSMDASETEQIKNPMLKTIGIFMLGSVIVCYGGYKYFSSKMPDPPAPSVVSSSAPSSVGSVRGDSSSKPGSVGGSFIPIGQPRKREQTPYVVYVPLDSATRLSPLSGDVEWLYVWRGNLFPRRSFPYRTTYRDGKLYAILDYDLFASMFSQGERPDNIFILNAPGRGDVGGSDTTGRSAARSDLSGGPARTGV